MADYDHRRVVIGYPVYFPTKFTILNMESPDRLTTAEMQYSIYDGMYGVFLIDRPNRQPVVALPFPGALKGIPIDGAGSGPSVLSVDAFQYMNVDCRGRRICRPITEGGAGCGFHKE
jgi:hypothetical protein